MSDASKPTSDPRDPGKNADGSTLVKASKQGGAKVSNPHKEVADAATLAEIEAAAEDAMKDLTPEEAAALAAISGRAKPSVPQVCFVKCEYTAGDVKTGTDDPDSPLAKKWEEKGIRVFVQAHKADGSVIGMRTMTATAAIEAMRTARSGRMVSL